MVGCKAPDQKDPIIAKRAALSLVQHLVKTISDNLTPFEKHLATEQDLWQGLLDCSKAYPAVLLWHNNGKCHMVFKSLALGSCWCLIMFWMLRGLMSGGNGWA